MEHSGFSKILLGLDGSPYAEAAIEYACRIALNHNATTIIVKPEDMFTL